ncbi:MAG: hypothetical protein GWN79_16745, partial [Actinobacteria bacterium]|nr:hypothetical protein [Gemmatimonadota bacterium]NIU20622.1 hypothetical protein [Actinomycetota bacterium]NIU77199.1 hypothetical protein [Gammaproteobacteria bacterium]NIV57117.1 hypothetical protein [Actinomycetota bacterium]NIW35949.1 hypothetical protein [Gemmatimonadota bacterium]
FDRWTPNPALAAGLGALIPLGTAWAARIEGRYTWIADREYSDLLGEELRVGALRLGLDYRVTR